MLRKTLSIFAFLTAFGFLLFFGSPASAGGWPIYTWAWDNPDAWRPDYRMTYVRVHLAPDVPCKGTTVTFKYENPEPGDNVSAGNDSGTFTFTEESTKYSKFNGQLIPDCNTYAKFYSTNNALKYGIAEFKTTDGSIYSAKFALNFHLSTPGNTEAEEKYPLPWEEEYTKNIPVPSIIPSVVPDTYFPIDLTLKMTGQNLFDAPKGKFRRVSFEWNGSPGTDVRYTLYKRPDSDAPRGSEGWATNGDLLAGSPGTTILSAGNDWYVKVEACRVSDPSICISSPSIFVAKLSPGSEPTNQTTQTQNSVVNDKQLQQRLDSLQNQLEESQKRQSLLESRLEQLIRWIKSIFPFFR